MRLSRKLQETMRLNPSCAKRSIAFVVVVGAPVILSVVGFSTSGVAAAAQSTIGNVVARSLFAALQSAGAVGGFSMAANWPRPQRFRPRREYGHHMQERRCF